MSFCLVSQSEIRSCGTYKHSRETDSRTDVLYPFSDFHSIGGRMLINIIFLYDANVQTKINNRCCILLYFTNRPISGWHFT
jgi:hypothetical protein